MNYKLIGRQKKLLDLLSSNLQLTGDSLAQILSVSSRTIRSDIANINGVFQEEIIISSSKGYSINPVHFQLLRYIDTYFDETILKRQLTWLLFSGNLRYSLDELAERFYTNPSVILHLMKEISADLYLDQLVLKKKDNVYHIEGSEFGKRIYLNRIVLNEAHEPIFEVSQYASYFEQLDLEEIKKTIISALLQNNIVPSEISIGNLTLNIAITINRIINGYSLNNFFQGMAIPIRQSEYSFAQLIGDYLYHKYQIEISENDLKYIYMLVLGQSKRKYEDLLSEGFIEDISEILSDTFSHFSLVLSYERILRELSFHIYYLIIRSNVGNYTSNSLLENIKTYCPFVYDVAVYLTNQISHKFAIVIADCEIGFLALLIGGLLDDGQGSLEKINTVLICGSHISIGKTILAKLESKYENKLNFLGIIPEYPDNLAESKTILYLSFLSLPVPFKNVINISSLLTSSDYKKVDNYIEFVKAEIERKKLKKLTKTFFCEELFFHNIKLNSKYEIIRYLGEQVVKHGYADSDFIDSTIKREKISSTCFLDSFAIPHAIHLNAIKSTFCVLINDKGMAWDDKKIKFVCLIAISKEDSDKLQILYPHIVDILCDYEQIAKLSQVKNFEDFLGCINEIF